MSDDELSAIAKQAALDMLRAFEKTNAEGPDVVYAVECFAAYMLGTMVFPGHDHELLDDVHSGIAAALLSFRKMQDGKGLRH